MTNKLEISRDKLESLLAMLLDGVPGNPDYILEELRALLAAPALCGTHTGDSCKYCGGSGSQHQGEPIAYQARHSVTEPWFFTDKPGYWEWRPLYTSQPAPVAVKYPSVSQAMKLVMRYQESVRTNVTGTTNWAANLGMFIVNHIKELNK